MIFVDTSVWIDFFNGSRTKQADLLYNSLAKEIVVIGELVMLEVLQGFRKDNDYKIAKSLLKRLKFDSMSGIELSIKSAENYRLLTAKGLKPKKTTDILIATFCIIKNYPLLHNDTDFKPLEKYCGLKVVI